MMLEMKSNVFLHLKELNHELAESFLRSREIAITEWLPAISLNNTSFNSYPHLRNLYYNLDMLFEMNNHKNNGFELNLSGLELYSILASILFHDLGRYWDDEKKKHGTLTRNEINRNWTYFQIPSTEIKDTIGRICEFHEPENKKEIEKELVTRSIYPYGKVRERELAALLVLVDNMDST